MKNIFTVLVLVLFCGSANALERATGEVVSMEVTAMPNGVSFFLTGGTPSCPAGTRLSWVGSTVDSNKAIYTTVLAALTNHNEIAAYINDGDTTCRVRFVYISS